MEDELMELQITIDCHKNDVADLIENSETFDELVDELNEYFELDEAYYSDRNMWKELVRKAKKSEVK